MFLFLRCLTDTASATALALHLHAHHTDAALMSTRASTIAVTSRARGPGVGLQQGVQISPLTPEATDTSAGEQRGVADSTMARGKARTTPRRRARSAELRRRRSAARADSIAAATSTTAANTPVWAGGSGAWMWAVLAVASIVLSSVTAYRLGRRRRVEPVDVAGDGPHVEADGAPHRDAPTPVAVFRRRFVPHHFQNAGEIRLAQALTRYFPAPDHHLMNHLTLPIAGGTTQVDHVLISRHGIFVIETKHHTGFILADATQRQWTKLIGTKRYPFQNPIHQNYRHLRAVTELLDVVPEASIQSVVVFTGDAKFAKAMPPGVFDIDGALAHIAAVRSTVLTRDTMQLVIGRLEMTRLAISRRTDVEHAEYLARRWGNDWDASASDRG